MLSIPEIILAFCSTIGLLSLSLLLGGAFQYGIKKSFPGLKGTKDIGLFWKLFTGTFLLISVYAIVCTKGITLFLIIPVLLFFFVKKKLEDVPFLSAHEQKQQLIFFCCSVIFNFFFYLWAINSFSADYVTCVSGDFNVYYRSAQRLNQFGIETSDINPVYVARYATPYHFGDIWMYALVSRMVSTNPSLVYLAAFTHFSIIFINGIYCYISQRFRQYLSGKSFYLYLLLFAGLFTGFNAFFPRFIIPSAESYTLSVMNWSKVLVPSCFLIGLILLSRERNWWLLVLLGIIGGLSFINAMPAIFITIFFVLTINLLRKEITIKQWLSFHLFAVVVVAGFVVVLYKVIPSFMGIEAGHSVAMERSLNIRSYLLTASKIFIGGWFQLFVLTPFVLIFLAGLVISGKLRDLKRKIIGLDNDLLFMIFTITSGLICWALLHPFEVDSVQFFTNVISPVYAFSIAFMAFYVILVVQKKVISIVMVVCVLLSVVFHKDSVFFVNKYERKEWDQITRYLGQHKTSHFFANLQPQSHYTSYFDKQTVNFMPLNILTYYWPDYHNFSLIAPFVKVNPNSFYAPYEEQKLKEAPFYIYYKENDGKANDLSLMKSFIDINKIDYITVSQDTVLPSAFRQYVADSLVVSNTQTTIYRISH